MTQKPDIDRGFETGIRTAVMWLHERAEQMNDPKAQRILNAAADHLGKDHAHYSGKAERRARAKRPDGFSDDAIRAEL